MKRLNNKGQGMVDYLLILSLIVMVGMVGIMLFGEALWDFFQFIGDQIQNLV